MEEAAGHPNCHRRPKKCRNNYPDASVGNVLLLETVVVPWRWTLGWTLGDPRQEPTRTAEGGRPCIPREQEGLYMKKLATTGDQVNLKDCLVQGPGRAEPGRGRRGPRVELATRVGTLTPARRQEVTSANWRGGLASHPRGPARSRRGPASCRRGPANCPWWPASCL